MVTGDGDSLGLEGGTSFLQPLADDHFLLSGLWETQRRADPQASHFLGDSPVRLQFTG